MKSKMFSQMDLSEIRVLDKSEMKRMTGGKEAGSYCTVIMGNAAPGCGPRTPSTFFCADEPDTCQAAAEQITNCDNNVCCDDVNCS
jgi:hypothetical protein